jgi:hypothetical protein
MDSAAESKLWASSPDKLIRKSRRFGIRFLCGLE